MRRTVQAILIFSFTLLSVHSVFAAPGVLSISPASQSLVAARNSPIMITFDTALDPATVHASNVKVFGKWTGVVNGTVQLENNDTRIRFTPSSLFSAGDMVMVTISKGIKSQTGDSLAKGYSWLFWVSTIPGNLNLSEVGRVSVRRVGEPHIQTYGAHGCDLNKDGFSDFFVPNEVSNDCRVFMNDSTGSYTNFTIYPIPNGSRPSTNECADFNADGNPDVAVGNSAGDSVTVFLGNGSGGFVSIKNYRTAGGVRGLSIADLDGDGDADIVTANRSGNNIAILLNNGNGTFAPRTVMEANGSGETACAVADANGDGILDLFVGAYSSSEIILLLGNGNGGFTFSSKVAAGGGGPWMIAIGDVNGDGNVDVVSANSNANNTSVIFGNGQGGLSAAVAYATYPTINSFPIAIDLGDIDGDGDLDLVLSNFSGRNWNVFENNGSGTFINRRILASSSAGSCATLHDRDNDGDLDMTGIDENDDLIFLFENQPPTSVVSGNLHPKDYSLMQNFPNPFNPDTEIRFEVPVTARITLTIHDISGQVVANLLSEEKSAGAHSMRWNGRRDDGRDVSSGVYFCSMKAQPSNTRSARTVGVRKLLLLR